MIKDKLLALRKRSGMSQQEVAVAIGVTRQTVSNWEQGQGAPSLDKAAELLGVTENWLRVSYAQKSARFGSPKVVEQEIVALIDTADVASIVAEGA